MDAFLLKLDYCMGTTFMEKDVQMLVLGWQKAEYFYSKPPYRRWSLDIHSDYLQHVRQSCFREHLGEHLQNIVQDLDSNKKSICWLISISAHYLLKGKPHTILPPVDRVGEPNLEKWSTVTSRARVPGYSHQWPLSYFLSLFPTEFGLSCPK